MDTPKDKEYIPSPRARRFVQRAIQGQYFKYLGKSGRLWLVTAQEDPAASVYVSNVDEGGPDYPRERGFGSNLVTFGLVGGGEIKLKGPWHSNPESLFEDTGVDVRKKALIQRA